MDRAFGRHPHIPGKAADEKLTELARPPVGLVALEGNDQALDLVRQLVGVADRPPRAVAQGLKPMLFIAVENLVAGLANSRHKTVISSPSSRRATKRRRSSLTELSFHGIHTSRLPQQTKSVTHVSGTKCHLCLGPLTPPLVTCAGVL
jgi:hypothetical protein